MWIWNAKQMMWEWEWVIDERWLRKLYPKK